MNLSHLVNRNALAWDPRNSKFEFRAYHPSTRAGLFCKSQIKEIEQNSESNAISVYILYLCFLPDAKTTAFLLQK